MAILRCYLVTMLEPWSERGLYPYNDNSGKCSLQGSFLPTMQHLTYMLLSMKIALQDPVTCLSHHRVDYANSLYYGMSKQNMARLQQIQNAAAHFVSRSRVHISPILSQLHWLPVSCRVKFKVLVQVYRAIYIIWHQSISAR